MDKEKKYKIRVYVTNMNVQLGVGDIINDAIDSKLFVLSNSYDGINGIVAIYDGEITKSGLKLFIGFGVSYFPLDSYGDFIITCPNCGERIDDDMILHTYDENVLSGYNIYCDREYCGTQMANVKFIG